jgi:hypothetical protein
MGLWPIYVSKGKECFKKLCCHQDKIQEVADGFGSMKIISMPNEQNLNMVVTE